MKYLLKKYWYILALALVINIPIVVMGCVRTDQTVLLKGDTTFVEDFVEIENAHKGTGSFSTIYVVSFDHSTILQNFFLQKDTTSEVSDLPDSYLHFTDSEMNQMGKIQHQSSITYSLIVAYKEAAKKDSSIHLDYEFESLAVSYYTAKSDFRINDQIIGINEVMAKDDYAAFREAFNQRKLGDTVTIIRNGFKTTISLNEYNFNQFGGYSQYKINLETASPKYKIKETNVGGPSGGLLQTLALYNALVSEDITKGHVIAGTGTISPDGTVGPIGGIQQKIYTAFDDKIEIFLCPEENYADALLAYNTLPNKEKMKLYPVATLEEALEVLANA